MEDFRPAGDVVLYIQEPPLGPLLSWVEKGVGAGSWAGAHREGQHVFLSVWGLGGLLPLLS